MLRNKKYLFMAVLLVLCVSLGAMGCVRTGGGNTGTTSQVMFKEKASPTDVENFLAASKGKVVLVNVFASWCGYCMQELPDIVSLRAKYPEDRLAVLGVALEDDSTLPDLKRVISEMKVSYPVYVAGDDFAEKNNITGIPVTIIYDREGKEYRTIMGYVGKEEIEKPLMELLNK